LQKTKHIDIRTAIPGPKSVEIHRRIHAATPRAVSVSLPVVDRAEDALVIDIDGNTMIDLTGGVGVQNVGHRNPRVVAALEEQIRRFLHTDFTNIPYESYVQLAERINKTFPGGGDDICSIYFNSGAEAVENAIKIARAATGRKGIISFEGAFHGRTLMAMTLTSKVHPYKARMGPYAPEVYRVPFPYSYRCDMAEGPDHVCGPRCYSRIERALLTQVAAEDVAAVIVEPVQGEGGFVVPPTDFLPWLRAFTEKHGILLIVDEVQTGFGRTGKFWATEHSGIRPDLLTMAKSIANGVPLSGVMGRREYMDGPGPSQIGGTYVGNPLATAAANAVMDAFDQDGVLEMGVRQGEQIRARLEELKAQSPYVGEVRGLGPMLAVELVKDRTTKEPNPELTGRVVQRAMDRGVLMLTAGIYGNVIRFLQPLTTPADVIDEALDVVVASVLEG
jgi:4-aminobutyrate aminotransferase/(S)-3-amino-2-methylpropionate transaminase